MEETECAIDQNPGDDDGRDPESGANLGCRAERILHAWTLPHVARLAGSWHWCTTVGLIEVALPRIPTTSQMMKITCTAAKNHRKIRRFSRGLTFRVAAAVPLAWLWAAWDWAVSAYVTLNRGVTGCGTA